MGLSIHYGGTIKDGALVPALVEEVRDLCDSLNRSYHLFDDENFKGIGFNPPECEPVFLTFNNGTEIICPIKWQYKIEPMNFVSAKTQYAGIEVHRAVLKLLKYLEEKYFAAFCMDDEGGYWNVWDEKVLEESFARYNFLVKAVAEALDDFERKPGEGTGSLAERLEEFLKGRWDSPHENS